MDDAMDDAMPDLETSVLDYLWDMADRGDNQAEHLAMSMELELRGLEL